MNGPPRFGILRIVSRIFAAFLLLLNTIFWCFFLYLIFLFKSIWPFKKGKRGAMEIMVAIAENWISGNSFILEFVHRVRWQVQGVEHLSPKKSYLVVANHQSWVDILVLQKVLNRKIPFLRFFLKKQLIYVPILGLAWWALDFPFMKRHSKAFLQKYPDKRREDLETTRRACQKLKGKLVSILNFLEGTRLTKEKQRLQQSPYKNLLKPKAGGLAFVIEVLPDQFDSLLDVTLYYPSGPVSFWGLIVGRFKEMAVHIEEFKIPDAFKNGHYLEDEAYRQAFQAWLSELWLKKDQRIELMRKQRFQ